MARLEVGRGNAKYRAGRPLEHVRCIAVDWSGRVDPAGQRAHIWLAEVQHSQFVRLESGRTRDAVVNVLLEEVRAGGSVVIGLDFAFSFPQWYLYRRELGNVGELWDLAGREGEQWLDGNTWPFWGRPGLYQNLPENLTKHRQFRLTDSLYGGRSVFEVYHAGAVGTGTIRGFPALVRLREAAAAIWPFDAVNPDGANVVEIYPRVFYGNSVPTTDNPAGRDSRRRYLQRVYPGLGHEWANIMIQSGDAFDAGVSALVMSAHVGELLQLEQVDEPPRSVEGQIWSPQ